MKNLNLLTWLTQLGLSTALPPLGFILFAVWLRNRWGWGIWVLWIGILLGLVFAVNGLRISLKAMENIAGDNKEQPPQVSFNDHE